MKKKVENTEKMDDTKFKEDWVRAGKIFVRSTICYIGDPCFFLHNTRKNKQNDFGKNWNDFCKKLKNNDRTAQLMFNSGDTGLGMALRTPHNDCLYSVFIKKDEKGRLVELRISFL